MRPPPPEMLPRYHQLNQIAVTTNCVKRDIKVKKLCVQNVDVIQCTTPNKAECLRPVHVQPPSQVNSGLVHMSGRVNSLELLYLLSFTVIYHCVRRLDISDCA